MTTPLRLLLLLAVWAAGGVRDAGAQMPSVAEKMRELVVAQEIVRHIVTTESLPDFSTSNFGDPPAMIIPVRLDSVFTADGTVRVWRGRVATSPHPFTRPMMAEDGERVWRLSGFANADLLAVSRKLDPPELGREGMRARSELLLRLMDYNGGLRLHYLARPILDTAVARAWAEYRPESMWPTDGIVRTADGYWIAVVTGLSLDHLAWGGDLIWRPVAAGLVFRPDGELLAYGYRQEVMNSFSTSWRPEAVVADAQLHLLDGSPFVYRAGELALKYGFTRIRSHPLKDGEFDFRLWWGFGVQGESGMILQYREGRWSGFAVTDNLNVTRSTSLFPEDWPSIWTRIQQFQLESLPPRPERPDRVIVNDGLAVVVQLRRGGTYEDWVYDNPEVFDTPADRRILALADSVEKWARR